jgi:ABC-type glycerol-3-phosphate transport system substrate-binding protein
MSKEWDKSNRKTLKSASIGSFRLLLAILFLFSAGCVQTSLSRTQTTATQVLLNTPTFVPTLQTTMTPNAPKIIRIWLPPQFAPAVTTSAGKLLQYRLDEFSARRPGISIEVRLKAQEGPAGLLDSLTIASAAAPQALPDIVALPRPALEAAALKGLLHPYDGLSRDMEDTDWYENARQLAQVQNSVFGLPFACDALLLVYRTNVLNTPPGDLESILKTNEILVFPAGDPQELFILTLYMASGGQITDNKGKPFLDEQILSKVLSFLHEAQANGVMPTWLTQYQTYDQTWQVFTEQHTNLVVSWTSDYLANPVENTAIAPIPVSNGKPFSLSTGWVWAITSPRADALNLSVELAEFLSESSFLAQWSAAAGYLPPRPSSLSSWQNKALIATADQIARSAMIYPSTDLLESIAPLLSKAVVQVMKNEIDPQTAARQAVESLANK